MNNNKTPVLKAMMSTSKSGGEKNEVHFALSKIMDEKHTYIYKKLVVPMSMRSIYWKFFGFPATDDGDILTRLKIVCILCKTQIAYNRNTSNLRMHLQNKHAQELVELESTKVPKKDYIAQDAKEKRAAKKLLKATSHIYTTNIDGTVQIDSDLQFVTDPTVNLSNIDEDLSLEQPIKVTSKGESSKDNQISYVMAEDSLQTSIDGKTVSDAITEFIIIDMQLPEIVEGRGFQRLIATLKSPCEIPSKHKLEEEIIPKVYDSFRESVASHLSCLNTEIGMTMEEWKSHSDENFVTFSIYYQNPGETNLDMKVLSTLHAPLDWGEHQWGNLIDTLLLEWGLRIEKITAVVLASARPEIIAALADRNLTVIPCLLYTLQVCAQACFDNPDIALILAKCRAIVGVITGNGSAAANLMMQEQFLELDDTGLLIDYPQVWMSTYTMLEQMVIRKNIISTIIETTEGFNQECVELTTDQWKMLEDIVAVLEPFKVTIMTLSEEKMPIISLLKPLLWQLVSSHLKPKDTDSDLARSFKDSLSDMLVERYADPSVTLLLQIATSLDPRFKQLPYATEEDKSMASKPIREKLVKLIEEEGCEPMDIKHEDNPPSKKNRLSGMELLLGNLYPAKSSIPAEERVDLELVQYQTEPTAPLAYCSLQWWARVSAKCPNLSKLARRYNCVPACCEPPTRIPPEAQIVYDTRRAALPSHLIDKILFLHGNHTV